MPKKGGSGGASKDLVPRVRDAPDLPSLLALLEEAKQQELGAGPLGAVLNTLATKAAADSKGLAPEALKAAEELLEAAVASSGGRPPESAVTVMVRLCCLGGAPQRALQLVEEARVAGMKPRLRTLAAILAQAASVGDRATCDGVWARMISLGLEPQDTEYAAMLRGLRGAPERQREVLREMLNDRSLPSEPTLIEEIGQVFGVAAVMDLQAREPPLAEGLEEAAGRWRVGWTTVDVEGVCGLSQHRLQALRISPAEERELLTCTAKLANRSRGFRLFQKWLGDQEPYDVIIDGANVGYNNQNHEGGHFQYQQIEAVVQHFRAQGRRILLVLHAKWLKENADLSVVRRKRRKFNQISSKDSPPQGEEEEEENVQDGQPDVAYPHEGVTEAEREAAPGTPLHFVRAWKELGILVCVPFYDCDDWYWLHAALDSCRRGREHVQVISNDRGRDHQWRMAGCEAFLQWQDRHMTRVSIQSADESQPGSKPTPHLAPPRPYSRRAQVSQDGRAWHFPVPSIRTLAEQRQSGHPVSNRELESAEYRWLAAWRSPP